MVVLQRKALGATSRQLAVARNVVVELRAQLEVATEQLLQDTAHTLLLPTLGRTASIAPTFSRTNSLAHTLANTSRNHMAGTQFTCFTGTIVGILTGEEVGGRHDDKLRVHQNLLSPVL
jgi:ABC-type nitrate/sulfonate/bicarbonate transport system permease component